MSVKFNNHSANERRRNAEVSFRDILTRRFTELNAGADAVQTATLRVFPNLFAAPTPVKPEITPVEEQPIITNEPLAEIIPIEEPVVTSELSEQDKRLIAARQATEEAHYESAA